MYLSEGYRLFMFERADLLFLPL